ncbi:hypothetical protein [Flavobacterium psychrophilum]|uniref:hypothetical protein n=1 Tax=Flavobacterium psychrophilum TaxID=96345 RepID=UPI000B7C0899|nr:hypothetical protein [Flavobacterium psychrophilum]MCB6089680.1 hypothetical protein [Flavobacterium psychrophilum]SNA75266.1 exported hypothetical protein [Flavobacterium psychrophilum]
MRKQLLLLAFLLFSTISSYAQEAYYGEIKTVTKTKGKTSTSISKVSLKIDEEYKSVSLNTGEPLRFSIIETSEDEKTGLKTYKVAVKDGDGTIEGIITANSEKATFENVKTKKIIIFDSRYPPSVKL